MIGMSISSSVIVLVSKFKMPTIVEKVKTGFRNEIIRSPSSKKEMKIVANFSVRFLRGL